MTRAELQLYRELNAGVNSFEDASADGPIAPPSPGGNINRMLKDKGNPSFIAQFDLQIITKYFTVAGAVYTNVAAAALAAGLKTQVAAFIFGHSDSNSGYSKMRTFYPVAGGWVYNDMFVMGYSLPRSLYNNLDANALAFLLPGDVVFPFSSGAANTVALVIVRCIQVPYAALLGALNSDKFVMNMIRYIIPDAATISQYQNNLGIYEQSIFGKLKVDNVAPNTYKQPENFQTNVIDIALKKGIDKQIGIGTYVNFDCVLVGLSLFVQAMDKLEY